MAEKKSKVYCQRELNGTSGKKGSDLGQFNHPTGLAFSWPRLQLVVAETENHRLQFICLKDLHFLRCVGSKGRRRGKNNKPSGLCFQPITDNLFVSDFHDHTIKVVDQEDKVLSVIGKAIRTSTRDGYFNCPTGVTCTQSGQLFVADQGNHRVQLLDSSGRFLSKFGRWGKGADEICLPYSVSMLDHRFAPSSSTSSLLLIVDSENHRLSVWDANGSKHIHNTDVKFWGRCVCVDLNGFVYVSTTAHEVRVLDPRKGFECLQTIGSHGSSPGFFEFPSGLCVDHFNTLIVADLFNHRLQFFD